MTLKGGNSGFRLDVAAFNFGHGEHPQGSGGKFRGNRRDERPPVIIKRYGVITVAP